MEKPKQELNVDFIGDQTPLTEAEENALHEYFELRKNGKIKVSKPGHASTKAFLSSVKNWRRLPKT